MDSILNVEKILDFCDVPQLFVARDRFDTQFLCLLYEDEPICRYSGIRISTLRLETFLSGESDLRTLFLEPENEKEFFDIQFQNNMYMATLLPDASLPESKLPLEGYTLSGDIRENIVVSVPLKDRGLLTELVHKFGWVCM
ncbi:MAG: hypothetical protein LUH63_05245 [Parabacteroides sp.]|nr:hypothetical protein [Parabacteroides sp.]